jgi:hypothetical protein
MVIALPAAIQSSISEHQPTRTSFTEHEQQRLHLVELTATTEWHLVVAGQPCPDHLESA